MADVYPCNRVDMASRMSLSELGAAASDGADIWGWTDPLDGHEYAIFTMTGGTAFVDVTDPQEPVHLGTLPTQTGTSIWRDAKTYQHYAYIVADNNGSHGVQVFDLHRLRSVANPPEIFAADAVYTGIGSVHNIVINEETGFGYAVGGPSSGGNGCNRGLHFIDLSDPLAPTPAGCFSADGYTHDAQCVVYRGPDATYFEHEICFASNTDTLTIVDVTNKGAPVQISRTGYTGSGYTHQGWLTEDHRWFLLDDELDEQGLGHNTKTRFWDVTDLDLPTVAFTYTAAVPAIDHNLYVKGNLAYLANYKSGLRILDLTDIESHSIEEVGFFDTFPSSDSASFDGAWSSYPYFESGTVIVSDISSGLFVLSPQLCDPIEVPSSVSATANGPSSIQVSWSSLGAEPGDTYEIRRAAGGCATPDPFQVVASGVSGTSWIDNAASGLVPEAYQVVRQRSGFCSSAPSACAEATTTGPCTAPPAFAGLTTATTGTSTGCSVRLGWSPAAPRCGGPASFDVHRSPNVGFTPSPANRIATSLTTQYTDFEVAAGQTRSWIVRAIDQANGASDANLVERVVTVTGSFADGEWVSGAEVGDPVLDGSDSDTLAKHVGWHIENTHARSGLRSWSSEGFAQACIGLASSPIELTVGEESMLSLWMLYDMNLDTEGAARSGGVVELSVDDGPWQLVHPIGGYPTVFGESDDACGFAAGTGAFSGTSLARWSQWLFDLSPWNGASVRFRVRASSDTAMAGEGWFVDDISLSHAQVAGGCATAFFADGFESGDTSLWSTAVP